MYSFINNFHSFLFIVAHHDDETLFFSGLLQKLKNKHIILLVLTCCNDENNKYVKSKINNFKEIIKLNKIDEYFCLNTENNILQKYDNKLIELNKYEKVFLNNLANIQKELDKLDIDYINKDGDLELRAKYQYNRRNIKKNKLKYRDKLQKVRKSRSDYVLSMDLCVDEHIELVNLKKKIVKFVLDRKVDCIYTHNKYGEYGHPQHKLLYLLLKSLKKNEFKHLNIFTTCNSILDSSYSINIDKKAKSDMIKKYNFKDNENNKDVWYNQCLNNYTFWVDNDNEYYEIMT